MPTNAFYAFAPALRGINSHAPHFYTDFHLLHSLQTALLTPFIHQMRPRAHLPLPRRAFITTARSWHSAHRCLWRGHCPRPRGFYYNRPFVTLCPFTQVRRALPVRGTPPIVACGAATAACTACGAATAPALRGIPNQQAHHTFAHRWTAAFAA